VYPSWYSDRPHVHSVVVYRWWVSTASPPDVKQSPHASRTDAAVSYAAAVSPLADVAASPGGVPTAGASVSRGDGDGDDDDDTAAAPAAANNPLASGAS